nr:immunoglobulin light chain junction region [Macaca mulatta]MOX78100.1 immunoglobulin light chain junction region [Macaca mulatta]MOX78801.1 immunoglobulin light chain junction region [Macaca mulatta]MOX79471.1 immunoglobulin light chain junction region [Macaca mulatta]MOX80986.1 immunoglobulin light chain junction region [Macaca mulatta]
DYYCAIWHSSVLGIF